MIYFNVELVQLAIQIVLDTYGQYHDEFIDECNDLCRIHLAKQNLFHKKGKEYARQLNAELRKKYPIIDNMLAVANQMVPKGSTICSNTCEIPPIDEMSELQQDHFGILCHVLLRKHRIEGIADFFSHLDYALPHSTPSSMSGIAGASQPLPVACQ